MLHGLAADGGALVTSNNAADSVPDWPLAYGKLVPPLVGGIRFEYTHRLLAGWFPSDAGSGDLGDRADNARWQRDWVGPRLYW